MMAHALRPVCDSPSAPSSGTETADGPLPGPRTLLPDEDSTNASTSPTDPPAQHSIDADGDDDPDYLDWLYGEESAPGGATGDSIVDQTLDDVLGDWARTGGNLTYDDVAVLATRRGLSAAQHGELLKRLDEAGVDLASRRTATSAKPPSSAGEDSVRQYLREIGRYSMIDAAREVELWSVMVQGKAASEEMRRADEAGLPHDTRRSLQMRVMAGQAAYNELVCANLRLVVSIAKAGQFARAGVEFADRIQDGNLGLMHAAELFDGSKGYKFSTYATWWIKQRIERGIADRGRTIRIPVHVHEKVRKVGRAVTRLRARLDREPSLTEISEFTGMEPGQVQAMLDLMRPVVSIDRLLGGEGDLRLADVLVHDEELDGRTDPAEIVTHAMLRSDVVRTLRKLLPDRSVQVLLRRFGVGSGEQETLEDIAADYTVTRERIRQLQSKATAILQDAPTARALRSYLIDDSRVSRSTEGRAV